MDYEYNKQYTEKSNTGFWVIAVLTIAICGYMAYAHFTQSIYSGTVAVDTYVQGIGIEQTEYNHMNSSGRAVVNFIFGTIFSVLLIGGIISILKKSLKILAICFFSSLIFSLVIFVINEVMQYS
ncbi:hypothetical protein M2451_001339 [Dysgonomonas sp. PFB1-18]|uniref:hypothetical protein n=1 Tax=unclassified Dysgonomonas TaxID=2630389 RepID=UPI0024762525|nr:MULTISPECIES: hypothetical protein [unclassified Dysgonomonas]MDL2303179.1 hypothetical protein [Dysgonomonas sp. OttesenSCG-928-D17]MDH6308773.1 hypothetical protein [Dysgonomonas sp. PF1-14]MDH6338530.1 hypothetical protein [Dysgonomonas sp. PF1-16]MDH6380022.1 hypothetical protein [Dysgonomonas sp. PFB1-18]MDH6397358.1 hypothetical protein [Dysgonomonas sp. PF1-23]